MSSAREPKPKIKITPEMMEAGGAELFTSLTDRVPDTWGFGPEIAASVYRRMEEVRRGRRPATGGRRRRPPEV